MEEKLLRNLRDAGHMLRNLSEGRDSQKRILILLSRTGVITQRALTEKLHVQSASSSEILKKMEEAGLILRTPNAQDHRTMDIALTEAGNSKAQAAAKQVAALHREMLACLTEEEKETMIALLERLNREWGTRYREKLSARAETKERGRNRKLSYDRP